MFKSSYFTLTILTIHDKPITLPPDKAEQLVQTGSKFRGDIINEMIHLEHKIERFLESYFCVEKSKRDNFLWLILRHRSMTFSNKVRVFFSILKDTLNMDISGIKSNLDDLITIRNRLAHGDLAYDSGDDALKISYKDGKDMKFLVLTAALKGDVDDKVKNVDHFLNRLLDQDGSNPD